MPALPLLAILLLGAPGASVLETPPSPGAQARAAWPDRTREVAVGDGVLVRSDLPESRTRAMLAAEIAALRRLSDPWGPPAGSRRIWCFASRREFEDVLRTAFGADARGREAVFIEHRGERIVALCDAAVAEDRLARDFAAAIAERHLVERMPAAPPWLRSALPQWFGDAMAHGGWHPGLTDASRQESLASAASDARLVGIDRLVRADRASWKANEAGGSGPLQQAEAAAFLATLLGDPADRSAAAAARRAALGRWWRLAGSGAEPVRAWHDTFGAALSAPLLEATQMTMTRPPTEAERALREARWLAEGRLHLEVRGESLEDPAALRTRLLERGFTIDAPCIDSAGRCRWRPDPAATPDWSPRSQPLDPGDVGASVAWSDAVGPWLVEIVWSRPQGSGWRYALRLRRP